MSLSTEQIQGSGTQELVRCVLGCLLHDIGKPIQRAHGHEAGKTHGVVGAEWLEKVFEKAQLVRQQKFEQTDIDSIVGAARYHHFEEIKQAALPSDSPAYIAYIADNIASGADRRSKTDDEQRMGFDATTNLHSVFNVFSPSVCAHAHAAAVARGTNDPHQFAPVQLDDRGPIEFAQSERRPFTQAHYGALADRIEHALQGLEPAPSFITSFLSVLEATLSYVPSSTSNKEVADISLYDHMKLTAAIGAAIFHYLNENNTTDLCSALYAHAKDFYGKQFARLASVDFSGIQSFIYTIHSSKAAKMLRARSFYLEILMENLLDDLIDRMGLTRANLLYSGGGHAYMLIPNTKEALRAWDEALAAINSWLLAHYDAALYVASATVPLSANTLMAEKDTEKNERHRVEYRELFAQLSQQISQQKLHRYSSEQIKELNARGHSGSECKVCHAVSDNLNGDGHCPLCAALTSASIHVQRDDFLLVTSTGQDGALPIGANRFLAFAKDEKMLKSRLQGDETEGIVRIYAKNKLYTGIAQGIHLWVGDYYDDQNGRLSQDGWSVYASEATGIDRLGVLRMDVDDLGRAFVAGFASYDDGRYNTLSRSATFSRQMALFFQHHINWMLQNPTYRVLTPQSEQPRKATIIYSGGDDVFLVGAWDDMLEFAVELRDSLARYTQQKLTVSAGIGIFSDKFPVSVMAEQTGALESAAKVWDGKDAVAVFDASMVFHWQDFKEGVLEEKFTVLDNFLACSADKGKAFVYKLLALLRDKESEQAAAIKQGDRGYDSQTNTGKTISFARWAYFLARMEQAYVSANAPADERQRFRDFTEQLHRWFSDPKQSRQLELAMNLYAYTTRK